MIERLVQHKRRNDTPNNGVYVHYIALFWVLVDVAAMNGCICTVS